MITLSSYEKLTDQIGKEETLYFFNEGMIQKRVCEMLENIRHTLLKYTIDLDVYDYHPRYLHYKFTFISRGIFIREINKIYPLDCLVYRS